MTIINLLAAGSKLSPDQIGLIVLLSFLALLLIAANIVLWYIFHKRGERKLCTYQLQNKRDKLLQQLDILRAGGVLSAEDIEQDDEDEEEMLVVDDEEDDDDKDEYVPAPPAANLSVVSQEEVDETMDAEIMAVAKISAQAREKLNMAASEFDRKRYYVRYAMGFEARLRSSSDEVKERYKDLMNELALYKGVKVKGSYRQQRIYKGRKTLGLITFAGKTLCVSFALNPADYAETKYRGIDKSDKKRFAKTPMLMKLTSSRRVEYAKYLLVQLADANTITLEEIPETLTFDLAAKTYDELFVDGKLQIIILGEVPDSVEQEPEEDEEDVEDLADEAVAEELTRYNRSYTARVIQADDELKARYSELKNYILAYKGIYNKITWKREAFFVDRRTCVATFAIRGKTLCLFLSADPAKFDGTKYKVEARPNAKLPTMYRIKSDRSTKFAKEMVDIVFAEAGIPENAEYKPINFRPVYKSTDNLINKGYIRVKTAVAETVTEVKPNGRKPVARKTSGEAEKVASAVAKSKTAKAPTKKSAGQPQNADGNQ